MTISIVIMQGALSVLTAASSTFIFLSLTDIHFHKIDHENM